MTSTENNERFMSRLDRDSQYRITALNCAINRAGQDGGISGGIDVFALAESYYGWLGGKSEVNKPVVEPIKN